MTALLVAVLVVATVAPAAAQSVPVRQGQWAAGDEPPPEPTPDEVTVNDKGTIVGDIDVDPSALPAEQISLNNIVFQPPRPTGVTAEGVPAEQISLNHIVFQPPRPTGVTADEVTAQDKDTIVGDIDLDPSAQPTDEVSLNGGSTITIIVTSG